LKAARWAAASPASLHIRSRPLLSVDTNGLLLSTANVAKKAKRHSRQVRNYCSCMYGSTSSTNNISYCRRSLEVQNITSNACCTRLTHGHPASLQRMLCHTEHRHTACSLPHPPHHTKCSVLPCYTQDMLGRWLS
jgi:hypothetical protein